jgi:branched-chain amino acid transport system permease protein
MIGQLLADGVLTGAAIGLGAIGLTLTYSILRFANFAHGEFVTWGAYLALVAAAGTGSVLGRAPIGELTFGWGLIAALFVAMAATALLAVALDWALFKRLRRHGTEVVVVIASFGASLTLRSLAEFLFGTEPRYYVHDIPLGLRLAGGLRATADQLVVLGLALTLMLAVHLLMTRTHLGRTMRATSENPTLAELAGIDVAAVVRLAWMLGGALAAASGVFLGITVQLRPSMGFDLVLPLFAATILGGIGSVPGAVLGGLLIGLAEALSVPLAGAQYRAAVSFVVLLLVLLARPRGLFGKAA